MEYSGLWRRLRVTEAESFAASLDRLERDAHFLNREAKKFVNTLTTNLTSFFREPHRFPMLAEFLSSRARRTPLRLWCAASCTGEEPYSIAMTMVEALGADTSARLLATDIDTQVLATASRGVYRIDASHSCGELRSKRFFLRGTGENDGMARIKPELQQLIEFAPQNLFDAEWHAQRRFAESFDAIFCRNVMINFDKPTQRQIIERFARVLRPGGLLIVGDAENFADSGDLFSRRGRTAYERACV